MIMWSIQMLYSKNINTYLKLYITSTPMPRQIYTKNVGLLGFTVIDNCSNSYLLCELNSISVT